MKTKASKAARIANKQSGRESTQLKIIERIGEKFGTVTLESLNKQTGIAKSTLTARMATHLYNGVFHELQKVGRYSTYQFEADGRKRRRYANERRKELRSKRVKGFLKNFKTELTAATLTEIKNLAL